MRKAKRGGGDLTRNFCKNRKACKTEWILRSASRLRDEESSQDVCTKLSDWGRSVVSISLCNGDITLFSCLGMAIGHEGYRLTRFLTSASLVRALHGKTNEHYFDLKIEVRREGKEVYRGFMGEYDLVHNVDVVKVYGFRDVNVGNFHRKLKSVPHGEACVVGQCGWGDDLRAYVDDKDLDSKTSKAWEGATIFSFDGEVVGMNLFLVTERAVFLPWGTILKCLDRYWTTWEKERGLARSTSLVDGFGAPVGGKSNRHPEGEPTATPQDFLTLWYRIVSTEHLDIDLGYPKLPSTMLDGVWAKLGEKASSRINRSVVALASFNGDFIVMRKKNFCMHGFFTGWNGSTKILTSASLIRNSGDENNIVENLRIEVLLPSNRSINGTLEHYDLHYNVALVSVKNCYNLRPANNLPSWPMCSDVAAIGRCFKSCELTATSEHLMFSTSALDCFLLTYSSCKITKTVKLSANLGGKLIRVARASSSKATMLDSVAALMVLLFFLVVLCIRSKQHVSWIGGPLVTLDGDVLGMNFYDKKIGTPFLFWADIREILASFDKRSTTGEICNDTCGVPLWKMDRDCSGRFNRWHVPMPCWRRPDYVDEDKFDADEREYCYIKGVKFRHA
ncbi:hypothetical protein BRADI_1g64901v3 [Brachypodium distachyon]|uniref:Uncharacterized protein n=1 Tax=Brachypodium distachyon TaxID=15368 RepID=A0A0Q3HH82_BRADI|nr:hypothetical protein BRADI_1g64901v3 [Brachypodium distachyon]